MDLIEKCFASFLKQKKKSLKVCSHWRAPQRIIIQSYSLQQFHPKVSVIQYKLKKNTPTSPHSSAGKAPCCLVLFDCGTNKSPILSCVLWRLQLLFWRGVCVCVCAYCCSALPIKQTQTCSCDTDREQRSQRAVTLRFHSVKHCLLSHLLQSKTAHANKQYMFWCNHICYIHLNREVF